MNRKLLAVLTLATLAATPVVASAQISTGISIAAGLAIPSGDGSNNIENGYNAALGLNIGAPLMPVGVRLEAGYNGFNAKGLPAGTTADVKILSGTVNATVGLGLPYAIGGVGYYQSRSNFKSGTTSASASENAFGVNGGVGITFPLGALSTFAEVRYHKVMGDIDSAYIPITFGIKF